MGSFGAGKRNTCTSRLLPGPELWLMGLIATPWGGVAHRIPAEGLSICLVGTPSVHASAPGTRRPHRIAATVSTCSGTWRTKVGARNRPYILGVRHGFLPPGACLKERWPGAIDPHTPSLPADAKARTGLEPGHRQVRHQHSPPRGVTHGLEEVEVAAASAPGVEQTLSRTMWGTCLEPSTQSASGLIQGTDEFRL